LPKCLVAALPDCQQYGNVAMDKSDEGASIMSGKRPSLAESLQRAARQELPPPVTSVSESARSRPAAKPAEGFYAATRAGKKKVTATLDPAMHKQLKGLAVERDTTTEALLVEAITDLFAKHGKQSIA
jgi:hypothetical protein